MICALGLDLDVTTCPRAPCALCMRKVGDEINRQIRVLNSHRTIARERHETDSYRDIDDIMGEIKTSLSARTP